MTTDKPEVVKPQDPSLKNSKILEGKSSLGDIKGMPSGVTCSWNGATYSPGGTVCDNGKTMHCNGDGVWIWAGGTC